jgi:hypothetical protein
MRRVFDMVRRDIIGDVCSIVYPMPEHPGDNATDDELHVFNELARGVAEAREHLRPQLELAWEDGDVDPLLDEIADARADLEAAELRLRRLIAYGREFVDPRPYTLDSLAQAAGMSVSGVRTAYDDAEIVDVARLIGAKLRRRDTEDKDAAS